LLFKKLADRTFLIYFQNSPGKKFINRDYGQRQILFYFIGYRHGVRNGYFF